MNIGYKFEGMKHFNKDRHNNRQLVKLKHKQDKFLNKIQHSSST